MLTHPRILPRTLVLLWSLLVLAAGTSSAENWKPRLGVGSDFPVSASARVSMDSPVGLGFTASLGTLPGAYADVINRIAVASGGYDEDTARIIRESLRSSLVISGSAGYDVFSKLRAHADFTVVTLGGTTTTPETTASFAGVPLPFGEESRRVDVSSTLRMFGLGVSWPFSLSPEIQLRLGLGGRFTVGAKTDVQSSGDSADEESYERQAERELNEIYTSYAHTPVLSLHFEYSF